MKLKNYILLLIILSTNHFLFAQIDLIATYIQCYNSIITPGKKVDVVINYTELNQKAVSGFNTTYYLSQNTTLEVDKDIVLYENIGVGLGAGTSSNSSNLQTYSPEDINWPAGTIYVLFVVDTKNNIAETNEGNNIVVSTGIPFSPAITSLEESIMPEADIFIYPNPCINYINIGNSNITDLKIIDLNDKVVLSGRESYLDISSLKSGIYSAFIYTPSGHVTKRFVKK